MSRDAIVTGKAKLLWQDFDENERAAVRFGLFPAAKMAVAERDLREAGIEPRDVPRLLAVALMECATQDGGMRA